MTHDERMRTLDAALMQIRKAQGVGLSVQKETFDYFHQMALDGIAECIRQREALRRVKQVSRERRPEAIAALGLANG